MIMLVTKRNKEMRGLIMRDLVFTTDIPTQVIFGSTQLTQDEFGQELKAVSFTFRKVFAELQGEARTNKNCQTHNGVLLSRPLLL